MICFSRSTSIVSSSCCSFSTIFWSNEIGKNPFLKQLLKKISAKEGAMITEKPVMKLQLSECLGIYMLGKEVIKSKDS